MAQHLSLASCKSPDSNQCQHPTFCLRKQNMVPEVKAAGLIIFRHLSAGTPIEYLLLQHSYGKRHWTPPKGHVDPGEDELTTAKRETEEEAGLKPSDYNIVDEFKHSIFYKARGKDKSVDYWLARLKDYNCHIKLSDEHQDFKWLQIKEACDLVGYEDMQNALKAASDFLSSK